MKKLDVCKTGRYQPVAEACSQLNVSRNTVMRLAAECGAVARFGRSVRIDMVMLFDHVKEQYQA